MERCFFILLAVGILSQAYCQNPNSREWYDANRDTIHTICMLDSLNQSTFIEDVCSIERKLNTITDLTIEVYRKNTDEIQGVPIDEVIIEQRGLKYQIFFKESGDSLVFIFELWDNNQLLFVPHQFIIQ